MSAQTKTPWADAHGVFDKPGDTYFRECSHYHRPEVLNYCVRNGNRCFHQAVWSPKKYVALVSTTHLKFGVELQERLKLRNCLPQEAEASIITQIRAVKPKSAIYFIRFVLDSIINQER
jgi:hypothetical protein